MKSECFICKAPIVVEESYAYIGRDRQYRKAEKDDYEGVPEHIINSSSKTDVVFVCEKCYKEKSGD